MPLKLKLRPNEKVIIGSAVLTNGALPTEFTVDSKVPILRARDILTEQQADTPCKRIYFLLQLMYIDQRRTPEHYNTYLKLVKELLQAAPSTVERVYDVSEAVLADDFYRALKCARPLIEYEAAILERARGRHLSPEAATADIP